MSNFAIAPWAFASQPYAPLSSGLITGRELNEQEFLDSPGGLVNE